MMVGWEEKARSIKTGQLGKGFLTLSGPRVIHQGQGFALLGSSHAHSSFVGFIPTLSSARGSQAESAVHYLFVLILSQKSSPQLFS